VQQSVLDGISASYPGLNTNTSGAIYIMRTQMFTAVHGDRASVPNICILITDGESENPNATISEAILARSQGR